MEGGGGSTGGGVLLGGGRGEGVDVKGRISVKCIKCQPILGVQL